MAGLYLNIVTRLQTAFASATEAREEPMCGNEDARAGSPRHFRSPPPPHPSFPVVAMRIKIQLLIFPPTTLLREEGVTSSPHVLLPRLNQEYSPQMSP
ncbi:hypothetical protein ANN_12069 [Periplaneta americana]|uniref:Uncharacterized protein n=1 Tax=Periplaneta americana TaxID=6978 RepID=A0ABQ8T8B6_PERAM|nr:hypothetical protein ANN_12069 [Periplaneta americana]